jgi:hypothetical protein
MNSTIELIVELTIGVIFLFAAGYTLSRVIGSDEYYDKILYDDDDFITKKNNDVSDDNNDIIHHVSI